MRIPIAVFWLMLNFLPTQADNSVSLSVCALDNDQFQFNVQGDVDGWWFNNFISADLETLIAQGEGAEFVVYYDGTTESIFADPDALNCRPMGDNWHPGASSIPITLTTDCAWIEIDNHDGGWSRVESNSVPVLLHYGEALIGSAGQSTDPGDYRVIPTECYP